MVKLGEVLRQSEDWITLHPDQMYKEVTVRLWGKGAVLRREVLGAEIASSSRLRVRTDQFIISRIDARNGAYGIIPPELDGHFVSNEYPTFDCDETKIQPEFLEAYFKNPEVWQKVAVGSKGLGDRRQRVQPEQVLAHKFWLPPLSWQNRIAETRSKLHAASTNRAIVTFELSALLPAILDRAFRGEL